MSRDYLSVAETAKLIRQVLKEAFPTVKFSVRSKSYSGGASIDIGYADGPNCTQVKALISPFEGAYFDGMIDYKGSRYASLDGKPVHFGANFIFVNREFSDAMVDRAIAYLVNKYGSKDLPTVADYRNGKANGSPMSNVGKFDNSWSWQALIYREGLVKRSSLLAKPSPTAERVKFTGDDGYGQGTVGPDGAGGESAYKAIEAARELQALASNR